jgi:hypothetical protein
MDHPHKAGDDSGGVVIAPHFVFTPPRSVIARLVRATQIQTPAFAGDMRYPDKPGDDNEGAVIAFSKAALDIDPPSPGFAFRSN